MSLSGKPACPQELSMKSLKCSFHYQISMLQASYRIFPYRNKGLKKSLVGIEFTKIELAGPGDQGKENVSLNHPDRKY